MSLLVDIFAAYWTPIVLIFTLLFVVIGGAVAQQKDGREGWMHYTEQGIILLVLACPCSIVIATPIPAVCAIAAAAKSGILIRGPAIIEALGVTTTLAVDKTGTLTSGFFAEQGRLSLTESCGRDEGEIMALAAALEEKSSHPLASAVTAAVLGCVGTYTEALASGQAKRREVKKVAVIEGVGVAGWVSTDDRQTEWVYVLCGNERMLQRGMVGALSKADSEAVGAFAQRHATASIIYIAIDDVLCALIALSDSLRPEAGEMVQRCHALGLAVCMLTGDDGGVARDVCGRVGIAEDRCWARLLPEEKLQWVRNAQRAVGHGSFAQPPCSSANSAAAPSDAKPGEQVEVLMARSPAGGQLVAMLGDGINDAAALAAARVGAAMGAGGSAMAVSAADLVLLSNNLLRVPQAVTLCRLTRRVIFFNCAFSVGIKLIAVGLALADRLALWAAILVDVGTLVVVVLVGCWPLVGLVDAKDGAK